MKSNFAFLSIAASLLLATSLFSSGEDNGEQSSLIINQTSTEVIGSTTSVNSLGTDAKGSLGAQSIFGSNLTIINIPVSYSITDNIRMHLTIPLVNNRAVFNGTGTDTKTGLGDISLAASYHFGSIMEAGMSDLKVRYKTSTGGDNNEGLGSGTENLAFSYDYKKYLSGFDLTGYALYVLNSISDESSFGVAREFGDSALIMLAASHESWLLPESTTSVKLTYSDTQEDTFTGFSSNNAISSTDLWMEWKNSTWIPFTPIALGLKIPLALDVSAGAVAEKKYLFYLTVDSPFL